MHPSHPEPFTRETPRLIIRDWRESDIRDYALMCADPEVMRYFPKPLSYQESLDSYQKIQEHHNTHGFGVWVMEDKRTKHFVGTLGLALPGFEEWFTPCVEIGWRLREAYWNQGLATEAALSVLHYAFDVLDQPHIHSFTALINIPSERVMQKCGMHRIGEFDHPRVDASSPLRRHVVYRIDAPISEHRTQE